MTSAPTTVAALRPFFAAAAVVRIEWPREVESAGLGAGGRLDHGQNRIRDGSNGDKLGGANHLD